ncbi:hypothetical protein Q4S45_02980 [Massilia sp. R2A-15]|uniref:hypothetical protein n=1 Tax=Massilia sp. R2A-15 TaxID=3064278 RepID=UPI00273549B5|nr:hypothetical protein [Massilia sp. R2A-15]WLI90103.1 hypothetical protein Q4S45_02980 [Massilia sp. R2A-15]
MNLVTLSSRLTGVLFLGALLASCGGGGGSSSPAPVPVQTPACSSVRIDADATIAAGKTGGATALACSGTLADVTWTQESGPAVTLLASRSATVSFEPGVAGTIRLRADMHLADGTAASATTDVVVTAPVAGSSLTVRADHSVRPQMDTSVRAWPTLASGETVSSIVWTQTAGPAVTMDTTNPRVLMFKSPATSTDTVLKFRAVLTTSSGRQDADDVMVGVETQAAKPNGYMFDATERVHPYRSTGVYTSVLTRCVYDISLFYVDSSHTNFCSAATLPLLQTEAGPGAVPSVAQIMGRVLVSHDFLGANFEQFLLTQDPYGDFRRLFAGVSAIVLGSHVRPSYYTSATGAIYLDANNFWLTPEQRDVVTEVPDYRLAYADALNYSSFGRLVKNNDYARRSFPSTLRVTRDTPDLIVDLGRLLYHELSHASDFYPTTDRSLTPALSIYANAVPRIAAKSLPSDALAAQYPLRSAEMKALGQVLFQGATPTDAQKAYTAAQVGSFFGPDVASDDYAYSIYKDNNSREDLAMLFEEFMMSYRHGIQYDIAFTNVFKDNMTFDDVIVAWGERGRIAEPSIKPRIKLVVDRIAPWIGAAAVDTLPAPIMMRVGQSWTANLAISPAGNAVQPSSLRMGVTGSAPRAVRDDLQGARRSH